MRYQTELKQMGYLKQSEKCIGIKRTKKVNRNLEQRRIEFCLNCTKEKCTGNCEELKGVK